MLSRLGRGGEPTALQWSELYLQKVGEADLGSYLPLHHHSHFSPSFPMLAEKWGVCEGKNNLLAPSPFPVASVHAASILVQSWGVLT